jgi:hypothetical protein
VGNAGVLIHKILVLITIWAKSLLVLTDLEQMQTDLTQAGGTLPHSELQNVLISVCSREEFSLCENNLVARMYEITIFS